ncbi:protein DETOXIFICATION 34 [Prunus yedoensis var. nudiflora]|uniref:Protein DETOXIFICATION 34 n=1 Tax=Prunus yedoensis var. nudiflora TaxID=2094558 RepID=A0A314UI87_PRUYE|nr:protein DETOXIFICATION 34 [Prunus yedoensis var. nudiflora]
MGIIRPYAALLTPRLYVIWRPQSFGQLQGQLPSIFCATMALIPSQTSLLGILEMWSSLLLQFLSLSLQISPSASWLAPPVSMLQTSPHAHVSKYNLRLILQQVFGWGTSGAAVAYDISAWGMAIAQVVYIVYWCNDGWKGLSWLAFKELWSFAKLSIASAHECEWVEEGMLFIGINAAISVRVSNELGSAHPRAAKYSVIIIILESLLIGLFFAVVILAAKDHFAIIFTDSKEMQQAVSRLAFLLSVTMLLNSVQPVISGVAVGGGWQALVAYINLFCYYVIGLPLGFLLGYKTSLRVEGIWIGMIFGTLLQTIILLCIVYKTNWNKR